MDTTENESWEDYFPAQDYSDVEEIRDSSNEIATESKIIDFKLNLAKFEDHHRARSDIMDLVEGIHVPSTPETLFKWYQFILWIVVTKAEFEHREEERIKKQNQIYAQKYAGISTLTLRETCEAKNLGAIGIREELIQRLMHYDFETKETAELEIPNLKDMCIVCVADILWRESVFNLTGKSNWTFDITELLPAELCTSIFDELIMKSKLTLRVAERMHVLKFGDQKPLLPSFVPPPFVSHPRVYQHCQIFALSTSAEGLPQSVNFVPSLEHAVSVMVSGDILLIYPGKYNGVQIINKSIELIGMGHADNIILDFTTFKKCTILASHVYIHNLTLFIDWKRSELPSPEKLREKWLYSSKESLVELVDCKLYGMGVYVKSRSSAILMNNIVRDTASSAILAKYSSDKILITGCTFFNNCITYGNHTVIMCCAVPVSPKRYIEIIHPVKYQILCVLKIAFNTFYLSREHGVFGVFVDIVNNTGGKDNKHDIDMVFNRVASRFVIKKNNFNSKGLQVAPAFNWRQPDTHIHKVERLQLEWESTEQIPRDELDKTVPNVCYLHRMPYMKWHESPIVWYYMCSQDCLWGVLKKPFTVKNVIWLSAEQFRCVLCHNPVVDTEAHDMDVTPFLPHGMNLASMVLYFCNNGHLQGKYLGGP